MKLPNSSYIGHHAELYDLFYAQKQYADEALFVHECIQKYRQRQALSLLDLACGTGNHAFELEKLGYKVIAMDYSGDMLDQARRKAIERNSNVEFHQQDMRTLNGVPERTFDIITCLFDSIGYVITNENIIKVLAGVRTYLEPDGLFIFEFWHASAMLKDYEPLRLRRWMLPGREVLRLSETEIDHVNQCAKVDYTVYEFFPNGTYKTFRETQVNRFFLLQEMMALLTVGGFETIKAFAGFNHDEIISSNTWHVLIVARPLKNY